MDMVDTHGNQDLSSRVNSGREEWLEKINES